MGYKNYMSQTEFAALCDISQAMVSKYARADRIVYRAKKVNAAESLRALEGSLDEDKRRAALKALEKMEAQAPPSLFNVIEGGKDGPPSGAGEPAAPQSWKAKKEQYAALEAELSYRERVGQLIDASEVSESVAAAVATFWTETEQKLKMEADAIAADLKLDAEQARKLRQLMIKNNRRLRENFSMACQRAAAEVGAPESVSPAVRPSP